MNYTPNYHLPQWDETDRVLMTDFNAAMAGIESGITAALEAANTAGGSGGSAQAAAEAAQAAANAAQATADTAQQSANSAMAKANAAWSASNPFFVTRSYTGSGSTSAVTINVGFRPSMAFLCSNNGHTAFSVYPGGGSRGLACTDTGVYVNMNGTEPLNKSGVTYYIAIFR